MYKDKTWQYKFFMKYIIFYIWKFLTNTINSNKAHVFLSNITSICSKWFTKNHSMASYSIHVIWLYMQTTHWTFFNVNLYCSWIILVIKLCLYFITIRIIILLLANDWATTWPNLVWHSISFIFLVKPFRKI